MKVSKTMRAVVAVLTCCGFLSADVLRAAGPAAVRVRDVALQTAGVLQGQVVDTRGTPQAGAHVAAVRDGQTLGVAETDAAGHFALANMPGGVYELQTASNTDVYRLWAPHTAPPAAQESVLLVNDENIALGQHHQGRSSLGWLANPWVLAGIVAAAIAIPLALSNRDDDDGS